MTRALDVYNGRERIGVIHKRRGEYVAYRLDGVQVGSFRTMKLASRALTGAPADDR